ncbi:hypothetical protein A2647_02985 [Candidatus Nomurabacteria bacterium RIFCSPHIGHO2_01_FULL_40_24b]|uniref:Nucleotidyl transferase AbiEii/AbiGii toxin family protein n=1 Tax=Candidatus Nomurabacteria bacterium RIFCSPHIGHO2_01_FULL_40_24b TaxID=1801739 RepID=A0A1F6V5T4_9BACT|nr:MAG: hypothetical protein A2647_02985 [Candidatus Nomurabacteria bacterium RIFCSPHIGHO2_01_FULL_40_24b]
MHLEALSDATRALWEKCRFLKDDFYLAGGTALALQLGHRRSVDLDFFSSQSIKKTSLKTIEETFKTPVSVSVRTSDELTVEISGVKMTLLHYPFPLILNTLPTDIVSLATVRDIAAMKAYALGRRGSLKDYVDLYAIFSRNIISLEIVIADANKKYDALFNDRLFCEQLLYTDDIEPEAINWIVAPVSLDDMKKYFREIVSAQKKHI